MKGQHIVGYWKGQTPQQPLCFAECGRVAERYGLCRVCWQRLTLLALAEWDRERDTEARQCA